jgi:predicted HTH domain antitoxin
MRVTIDLAEDFMRHADPARDVLEALAIQGYQSGALSSYQARTLPGLTRFEFDGFLKDHQVWEHAYSQEDLERDRETLALLDLDTGSRTPARRSSSPTLLLSTTWRS